MVAARRIASARMAAASPGDLAVAEFVDVFHQWMVGSSSAKVRPSRRTA
jgi:hypothetical protein